MNAEIVSRNEDGSLVVRIIPVGQYDAELLKESALQRDVRYNYTGSHDDRGRGIEATLEFRSPRRAR